MELNLLRLKLPQKNINTGRPLLSAGILLQESPQIRKPVDTEILGFLVPLESYGSERAELPSPLEDLLNSIEATDIQPQPLQVSE